MKLKKLAVASALAISAAVSPESGIWRSTHQSAVVAEKCTLCTYGYLYTGAVCLL